VTRRIRGPGTTAKNKYNNTQAVLTSVVLVKLSSYVQSMSLHIIRGIVKTRSSKGWPIFGYIIGPLELPKVITFFFRLLSDSVGRLYNKLQVSQIPVRIRKNYTTLFLTESPQNNSLNPIFERSYSTAWSVDPPVKEL